MINITKKLNFAGKYAGGLDACALKDDNYTLTQPSEYVDADNYIVEEWADEFELTLIDTGVKISLSLDWINHCELANGMSRHESGYLQYNTSSVDSARDTVSAAQQLADGAYWLSDADQLTLYKSLFDIIARYLEELADSEEDN